MFCRHPCCPSQGGHTYAANGTYVVTLTVTDGCGSSTFSDTLTFTVIAIDPAIGFGVSVYPNPAQNAATITATLPAAQRLKFSLTNALGQVVSSQDLGMQSGEFQHSFSVRSLTDGVYFVRLETENGPITTRLVVRN
jgi:PKD repeat protein